MHWLRNSLLVFFVATCADTALAHMTPPLVLHTEKEVVAGATRGAAKLSVREVRLSDTERDDVARRSGWRPPKGVRRFYVGRDKAGKPVAFVTFLSEFTIHGPVRVGIAIGPDGKVSNVEVLELTEETNAAFKPVLDRGFTEQLVGASGKPPLPPSAADLEAGSIARFYAELVTDLVGRAVALYEATAKST